MPISVAHSFAQIISSWDGPLVAGLADGTTRELPADTDVTLSELGVLAAWPGAEPAGVFWPWSAVVYIRQAAPAPSAPPPDSPPAVTPPESSQASPPAGDAAQMAGPQPPAAPPRPAPARDT